MGSRDKVGKPQVSYLRGRNEPAARDWCDVEVCHHGVSDLFYLELS